MPAKDIVDSVTVISAASPSPPGFGTPIVGVDLTAPQDALWGAFLIREFAQDTWPVVLLTLGFADGDPLYEWLETAFSQDLVPDKILVGKETSPKVAQITNFDLGDAGPAPAGTYTITLSGTPFEEILGAPSTRAAVVAALIVTIDLDPRFGAAAGADAEQLDVTAATAGVSFSFAAAAPVGEDWIVGTTTPSVGLSTDLALWEAERNDWYEVNELTGDIQLIASMGPVVESFPRDIIFMGSSSTSTDPDATVGTSATRGAALIVNFSRTGIAHRKSATSRPLAALVAKQLPKDPGSTNWSQQELRLSEGGDIWTSTETSALLGQGTNPGVYTYFEKIPSRNLPISRNVRMGDGTPIDLIRGRDWLNQQIVIKVIDALVDEEKIPYTDAGAAQITGVIRATLQNAVKVGLGVNDTISITTTARTDQLPSDVAARVWKGFRWGLTLAGAIDAVEIRGTLFIV